MFKDYKLRKFFVRFLLSILLLQISVLVEQRYLKNTPQQQQDTYQKLQDIIRNKELSFVKLYQQLLVDTTNFEKKLVGHKRNCQTRKL